MTDPAKSVPTLTLEEKASLTSGLNFWFTKPVSRVGIPSIMLTDGPHGIRKQTEGGDHLGLTDSVPATCFPPAVAMGCSFDPELLEQVGVALGVEARAAQVSVLLGPGINIKRSPLCGRNFEYLSEDPLLSGALGAALVRGIQSQGVGASLKHFAANNQETDRMRVSADIDPRPLREIYLRGFQRVVEDAQPWTVMCSYNRINGVYSSQNRWLLTDVLRGEWGFGGLVVSDWGAVSDRVAALKAGLDLEMPSTGGRTDQEIVDAVKAGSLDESVVDVAAGRVVDLVGKAVVDPDDVFDADEHHALARRVAAECVVLLKNDGVLPLAADTNVAVIGELARTPRYQGAGSSRINPTRLDNALDEMRALASVDVAFAPGYLDDGTTNDELRTAATDAARASEVAVVFVGVPAALESEGFDRTDLELPSEQTELLDAVIAANPNTVVVLSNGGVVRVSGFADRVPAIIEGWLLGQAGGGAIADVLFGVADPAGRLAETIPVRLEDTPSYTDFPGEHGHVRYGEGLFVGYRGVDARGTDVSFPFGHGLSYTTFDYSAVSVTVGDDVVVTMTVTNAGERSGSDVVQVYVGVPDSSVSRAPRELKGFAKVRLDAGESRQVEVPVRRADLAYWDTRVDGWVVEGGTYRVQIGASSRDIRATCTVDIDGDEVSIPLTLESSIGEILANPAAAEVLSKIFATADGAAPALDPAVLEMAASMPLERVLSFGNFGIGLEEIQQQLDVVNGKSN
ncbi:glycoside hydrolase family 3 C-terminal domain-containing protein [Rhodococcus artemisiae]|uniref:Glycoside hydrolase family 3 C-terminal domain-containing protein n=1 Tax=Rhodococcus artemisiae TaxID=714159 RepID=A0ABU7LIR6_9NOCA|nr:glycoside hydrolase family 3 C-terminal domain-containing protein [Rhodococcus artemisiae]MEE2061461.1 glycoside hydrolase family 3 C-terminal domain-containing protein [Rhodococcus artemisiae]